MSSVNPREKLWHPGSLHSFSFCDPDYKINRRALTEPTNTGQLTSGQATCASLVAAKTTPLSSMSSTEAASWPSQTNPAGNERVQTFAFWAGVTAAQ